MEHQGCCGQIPPESDWKRNPALDSGTPKNGTKTGMCHLVKDGHPVMTLEGILDDNMDEEDKTVWSTPVSSSSVAHTHISPICLLVKKCQDEYCGCHWNPQSEPPGWHLT